MQHCPKLGEPQSHWFIIIFSYFPDKMIFWLVVCMWFSTISSGMMISNEQPQSCNFGCKPAIRYSLVNIAMGNSHVQWVMIMSTLSSFVHGYETLPEGLRCISIVSPPCLSFCQRKDWGACSQILYRFWTIRIHKNLGYFTYYKPLVFGISL